MCVRNLKSLIEMISYGSLLIPLMSKKIPEELKLFALGRSGIMFGH